MSYSRTHEATRHIRTYPEYLRRWEREMLYSMADNKPKKKAEQEKAVDDMDLTPNPQAGYTVDKVENGYIVKMQKRPGFEGMVPSTFIATDMAHLERVLETIQTAQRRATLRNFADMNGLDIKL